MRELIAPALRVGVPEAGGRVWASTSLGHGDVPSRPQKPFILFGSMPQEPFTQVRQISRAYNVNYQIYVYDERGTYVVIDRILVLVRETLLGLVDEVTPAGDRCLDVVWLSNSQELDDTELDANMRYAVMRFTSGTRKEA